MGTRLTVIVDNVAEGDWTGEWGLSILAEHRGKRILVDTGASDLFQKNMDLWFVGGTPYYVTAVWWGYDAPYDMTNTLGKQQAKTRTCVMAWKAYMEQVQANLPYKAFPTSDGVVERAYCTQSGLLAGANCPSRAPGYHRDGYGLNLSGGPSRRPSQSRCARQLSRRESPWHGVKLILFAKASPFGRGGIPQG